MPPIPWKLINPDATAPLVLMASKFELAHHRTVPGFMIRALRVNSNAHKAPGVVGTALLAEPSRKRFWTLSAWASKEDLAAFVRTPLHQDVMRRYHDRMTLARFVTWTGDPQDLPPTWPDAQARLAAASAPV